MSRPLLLLACLAALGLSACNREVPPLAAAEPGSSAAAPAPPGVTGLPSSGAAAPASALPGALASGDGPGVAPGPAASSGSPPSEACAAGMALVSGQFCENPGYRCLGYLDAQGEGAFLRKHRCREYDPAGAVCKQPRTARRFCIDVDEYVPPGETLPRVNISWTEAGKLCAAQGKRLCREAEWQFACMGEQLQGYPYGWKRDAARCNHDLEDLTKRGKLLDHRVAPGDRPGCASPFGVRNLVGNVDEWTEREGQQPPFRSALRGGWWLAGRNNCLAATTAHDEHYNGAQTGFRCCADAK